MAFLPGLGKALLSPIMGLVGGHFNRKSQRRSEERQREWANEDYTKQRGHSLEDWNRENKYNSPAQQMQRLKEAGINPRHIYGSSAAPGQASSTRGTPQAPPSVKAKSFAGFQSAGLNFWAAKQAETTINNTKAQTLNINANTASTLGQTAYTLDQKNHFNNTKATLWDQLDASESLTRARVSTEYQTQQLVRLKKENQKISNQINQAELRLRKMGMTSRDPAWSRILIQFIKQGGDLTKLSEIVKYIRN